MVANRPQWLQWHVKSQKLSGLHSKPCFQNSQCYSKPVAVIYIYFTLELSKSLQISFSSCSDSCLSKVRVKIWDEEPYIGELHAVPIKFKNKWLSFHQLKIATAQNYEREVNLIQSAYILLDSPCEVFVTGKLARQLVVCLSNNDEITDSHNLFESSQGRSYLSFKRNFPHNFQKNS